MIRMKNLWSMLTIMMVAMLSISLTSCDGEEFYDSPFSTSDFVGTWKCTKSTDYTGSGTKEGSLVGKTVTFDTNGTYNASSTYLYAGSYTLSGNKVTLRSNRGGKYTAKVQINKTKRTMLMEGSSNDGNTFSYTFKKSY